MASENLISGDQFTWKVLFDYLLESLNINGSFYQNIKYKFFQDLNTLF